MFDQQYVVLFTYDVFQTDVQTFPVHHLNILTVMSDQLTLVPTGVLVAPVSPAVVHVGEV